MRHGLLLAAVCFGWGTIPLLAEQVEAAAVPPSTVVFARVWFAAAALGVTLLVRRRRRRRRRAPTHDREFVPSDRQPSPIDQPERGWATGPVPRGATPAGAPRRSDRLTRRAVLVTAVGAGAVLAAHWTAMFAAYERAPDGTVIFVIFLAPVVVASVERPGRHLVVALGVALAGFTLVTAPTLRAPDPSGTTATGLGLAVVSGALFVALVLLSKPAAERLGGLRLTFVEMVVAGVALAPAVMIAGTGDWRRALPWLAVLGLVHTAVGTALYLHVLARVPATEVGILGYLEPIGVVVFAWTLAGEQPSILTVTGGLVVIGGGVLALRATSTRSSASTTVSPSPIEATAAGASEAGLIRRTP